MNFEEACRRIDQREAEIVQTLRKLIAVDTTVPPGRNYDRLLDLVEPRFQHLGFSTQRVVIPEEELEVIPWPIEEPWQHDPFGGEVVDGRLYGRGASDMKGSIAGLLAALETMHEGGLTPNWDLTVVLCTDEEIGIFPGAYYLARKGYLNPRGHVLTLETGGMNPGEIWGSSGMVDLVITTRGRSSHSGSNYLGINALEAMVPIMEELLALKATVETRLSALPVFPDPRNPHTQLNAKLNLDVVQGGNKSNIVPATCTLVVNRRYLPEEHIEDVVVEVQAAVDRGKARSKALAVEVQAVLAYPAVRFDPQSRFRRKLREAYKTVHGYRDEDFRGVGGGGSVDMAFVAQVLGTDQIIGCGPGRSGESNAHGANESIRVSDLLAHAKILTHYLAF